MMDKPSCELCKARKVKCDRAEPACSWCVKHNRQCVYLRRQQPGIRSRFDDELLEAKVNRLDGLLQALGRRVEEHISQDHATISPASSFAARSPAALSSISDHTASSPVSGFLQDVGSIDRVLQMGGDGSASNALIARPGGAATEQQQQQQQQQQPWPPQGQQNPQQQVMALPSNMVWDAGATGQGHQGHRYHQRYAAASPGPFEPELPPHDLLYTLVDLYFKHCNTWCPILDRKTVFGVFFGATSLDEPDRVLLHAIVATTLRFSHDPRLTAKAREYYHATSKQVVRLYAMYHVSVPALRALVIASLDEIGTSDGPVGWNLLAMLTQNLQQLGLCDEASVYLAAADAYGEHDLTTPPLLPSKPESWIEDEGRRRLCWAVYLLDRYATIGTATADFLLDDHKMRRFLPCSYDLFSKNVPVVTRPSTVRLADRSSMSTPAGGGGGGGADKADKADSLGSFSYHCMLMRILSRIHTFLRAPVDLSSSADMARWRNTYLGLDATLDGWLRELPSEYSRISALCHSDPVSRVANWLMLHSAYVTAVMRLHAAAAYPAERSILFTPSQYAVQRCLTAVHSLVDITRDLHEAKGLDLLGPPFAFSLWVAAGLLLVHASTLDQTAAASAAAAAAAAANVDTSSATPTMPPAAVVVDSRIDFLIDALRHIGAHWEIANHYALVLARVVQRGRQGEMTFAQMRRSAHDLVLLTSATRQSGLEPPSSRVTSQCELDSLKVFSFFIYPQMTPMGQYSMTPSSGMSIDLPDDARGMADKRPFDGGGVPFYMGL